MKRTREEILEGRMVTGYILEMFGAIASLISFVLLVFSTSKFRTSIFGMFDVNAFVFMTVILFFLFIAFLGETVYIKARREKCGRITIGKDCK